jgi:hypothetical protein
MKQFRERLALLIAPWLTKPAQFGGMPPQVVYYSAPYTTSVPGGEFWNVVHR